MTIRPRARDKHAAQRDYFKHRVQRRASTIIDMHDVEWKVNRTPDRTAEALGGGNAHLLHRIPDGGVASSLDDLRPVPTPSLWDRTPLLKNASAMEALMTLIAVGTLAMLSASLWVKLLLQLSTVLSRALAG
jgi:hypothetical protein